MRAIYAVLGLIIGAVVDILVNLLATGIQQHVFPGQISGQAIWGLAGLALVGLLMGFWLGKRLELPASSPSTSVNTETADTITITRLRALLSYGKLKGKGIHLSDIILIGSRINIET